MKRLLLTYIIIIVSTSLYATAQTANQYQSNSDSIYTEKYVLWAAGKQNSPAQSIVDSLIRREQANHFANISHHRLIYLKAYVESRQFRPTMAITLLNSIYNTPELQNDPQTRLDVVTLLHNEYCILNQMDNATKYLLIALDYSLELKNLRAWHMLKIAYLEMLFYTTNDPTTPSQIDEIIHSMIKHTDQNSTHHIKWAMTVQVDVYQQLGQFDKAIAVLDEIITLLSNAQNDNPHEDLSFHIGEAYASQAMLYTKIGQMSIAKRKFDIAQTYLPDLPDQLSAPVCQSITDYLIASKRYNDALNYLRRYEEAAQESDPNSIYLVDLKKQLSTVYYQRGDYRNAWIYRNDAAILTDSLYARANYASANEMAAIYQHALNETEILNQKMTISTFRYYMIILIVSILALTVIMIIILRHARVIKHKNRILFHQIMELGEIESNQPPSTPKPKSKEVELFDKIDHHIKQNNAFLNANISREQIAAEIGTNKTYLSAAIQCARNETFSEYLNSLRLSHSRNLLINNCDDKIETIATMSGFNSSRTFYRLFHQKYSLTPTEFRQTHRSTIQTKS